MSELVVELLATIKRGPDSDTSVQAINALIDSGLRLRSMDDAQVVLEKTVSGNEFLAMIGKAPVELSSTSAVAAGLEVERSKPGGEVLSRPANKKPAEVSDKSAAKCHVCDGKVRSDGQPCPQCRKPTCSKCKIFSKGKRCTICLEVAQPNSSVKKKIQQEAKSSAAGKCELCRSSIGVFRKCDSCGKMACPNCRSRRFSGTHVEEIECNECTARPG